MGTSALIAGAVKQGLRELMGPIRYRFMLRFQPRRNRVYTQFFRFPHQYRALTEKVLPDQLCRDPSLSGRPLEVVVFACCSGEEVFTLAYQLRRHFPTVRVRIRGYDLVPEVIRQARTGSYTKQQLYAGPFVTEDFVQGAFDVEGELYRVKKALLEGISFEVADMTDPAFMRSIGTVDVVFAQNVLFHLPRRVARAAFESLIRLVRPGGVLFISGMDTDMRIEMTKASGLDPIEYLIEEIHEDARVDRGAQWANQYWGREPFSRRSADWLRRYCTIYTKRV